MEVNVNTLAEATFIELFSSVIADTPVDVGRLRGEWQTTRNTPANKQKDRIQKGDTEGATLEVSMNIKGPGLYYLTNLMPYAHRIEFYNYSKVKAPRGMVRINAKRIEGIVRRTARGLN